MNAQDTTANSRGVTTRATLYAVDQLGSCDDSKTDESSKVTSTTLSIPLPPSRKTTIQLEKHVVSKLNTSFNSDTAMSGSFETTTNIAGNGGDRILLPCGVDDNGENPKINKSCHHSPSLDNEKSVLTDTAVDGDSPRPGQSSSEHIDSSMRWSTHTNQASLDISQVNPANQNPILATDPEWLRHFDLTTFSVTPSFYNTNLSANHRDLVPPSTRNKPISTGSAMQNAKPTDTDHAARLDRLSNKFSELAIKSTARANKRLNLKPSFAKSTSESRPRYQMRRVHGKQKLRMQDPIDVQEMDRRLLLQISQRAAMTRAARMRLLYETADERIDRKEEERQLLLHRSANTTLAVLRRCKSDESSNDMRRELLVSVTDRASTLFRIADGVVRVVQEDLTE